MAKVTQKILASPWVDPFDLSGARSGEKAKRQVGYAKADAAAAAAKAEQDRLKAEEDARLKEEESKKKLATTQDESARSALSNYLAAEGSQTTRRKFLVGAK